MPSKCPNCNQVVDDAEKHAESGCVLGAVLGVLIDRDHDLSEVELDKIDADAFWNTFGGPAADWCANELGLPAYPEGD